MTAIDLQVRCGSYPFMYIAEDFGLPYGVVLRASEVNGNTERLSPRDFDCVWDCLGRAARVAHFTCAIRKALRERDE